MIFVNFKTYEEGTGKGAIILARELEAASKEAQIKVIIAVQAADIKDVISSVALEVWAQKVDAVEFGAHTGAILPEAVLEDGATGTFLNHSEARFADFNELAKASDRAKEVGLKTMIFVKDTEELKNACSLAPTFVAYEPPEFIGSTTTSVTQEKSEVIKKAYEISQLAGIPLVVGAGIHSEEDVKKSLKLGAVGVAVATDIVKSSDPKTELLNLMKAFTS